MTHYPPHLLKLIETFKKFPGVGAKSAERFVFEFIQWTEEKQKEFSETLSQTSQKLKHCEICGALIDTVGCSYCSNTRRDQSTLCVVAFPKDLFLIDATKQFNGLYHVLGGVISPMDQLSLDHQRIVQLKERIANSSIKEVILALDSTIEGDATALYVRKALEEAQLPISRLAFGLPMGSSFDYIDGGTLSRALEGRLSF